MANAFEWFKIIKDGNFIGAVNEHSFARYSPKSGRIHVCKAIDGQYVIVDGKYYRDEWMLPLDQNSYAEWESAKVLSIPKNEYDILIRAEFIDPIIEESSDEHEESSVKEKDVVTVEYVRTKKLAQLRDECGEMIKNGFDLFLSDEVSHHFSLSVEDQLNLLDLQKALNEGNDLIYHADGELMQFYGEEDARAILTGANKWKQYAIALYNSIKNWINNIDDISVIDSISFDSEIPDEYCTPVLQVLTENF